MSIANATMQTLSGLSGCDAAAEPAPAVDILVMVVDILVAVDIL